MNQHISCEFVDALKDQDQGGSSCDDQKQNPLNKMPSQNVQIEHLGFLGVFWGDKLLRHQSTLVILPNECAYRFKTQVLW